MKTSGMLALAAVVATVLMVAPTAASEELRLRVTSSTDAPVRFAVEGTGGGGMSVDQAGAIHSRTEHGRTVIELTTPAVIRLAPSDSFTLRLRVLGDSPPLEVTVAGSTQPNADRTVIGGGDILFARRQAGGPLELLRSGSVRLNPPGRF